MDKAQLLIMLAQQAPILLSALKNFNTPNANDALFNKGYDPGLMQETLNNTRFIDHPAFDGLELFDEKYPSINPLIPDTMPASSSESALLTKLGTTEMPTDLSNNSLVDLQKYFGDSSPAGRAAATMLLNDTNIGLEDPKKKLFKKLTNQ